MEIIISTIIENINEKIKNLGWSINENFDEGINNFIKHYL